MWVESRSVPKEAPMDLFSNGTGKIGTGQVPFRHKILSEPFQCFRSCVNGP